MRGYFKRINPNMNEAALNTDRNLIAKYVFGIRDPYQRTRIGDKNSATYQEALTHAQLVECTDSYCKDNHLGRRHKGLYQMGTGPETKESPSQLGGPVNQAMKATGKCYVCDRPGHIARDCYHRANASSRGRNRGRGGRGFSGGRGRTGSSGRSYGGRGGRSFRGRGHRNQSRGRAGLHAMAEPSEPDQEDEKPVTPKVEENRNGNGKKQGN